MLVNLNEVLKKAQKYDINIENKREVQLYEKIVQSKEKR